MRLRVASLYEVTCGGMTVRIGHSGMSSKTLQRKETRANTARPGIRACTLRRRPDALRSAAGAALLPNPALGQGAARLASAAPSRRVRSNTAATINVTTMKPASPSIPLANVPVSCLSTPTA